MWAISVGFCHCANQRVVVRMACNLAGDHTFIVASSCYLCATCSACILTNATLSPCSWARFSIKPGNDTWSGMYTSLSLLPRIGILSGTVRDSVQMLCSPSSQWAKVKVTTSGAAKSGPIIEEHVITMKHSECLFFQMWKFMRESEIPSLACFIFFLVWLNALTMVHTLMHKKDLCWFQKNGEMLPRELKGSRNVFFPERKKNPCLANWNEKPNAHLSCRLWDSWKSATEVFRKDILPHTIIVRIRSWSQSRFQFEIVKCIGKQNWNGTKASVKDQQNMYWITWIGSPIEFTVKQECSCSPHVPHTDIQLWIGVKCEAWIFLIRVSDYMNN